MSSFKRYADEIHDRYGYFATWLPNTRLELGDVGTQDGATFRRMTSLAELQLPFTLRRGRDSIDFTQTSSSGVNLTSDLGASVGSGSATVGEGKLSVDMSEEGAFLFRAMNCRVDEIGDKVGLGAAVVDLCRAGMWDKSWRVIDTIVRAESATIIVSNSAKASLALSASSPIALSSLARVDAGITVTAQHGDVLHFVAAKGLSPLFTLVGIKQSLWSSVFGGAMKFGGGDSTDEVPAELSGVDPFERVDP